MKTARYYGIEDIRCEELPIPNCGEKDVLIKVAYAGICGSDLHIYKKGMFIQNIPETMGHEFSGTVVKTGSKVHSLQAGDRVTAQSHGDMRNLHRLPDRTPRKLRNPGLHRRSKTRMLCQNTSHCPRRT